MSSEDDRDKLGIEDLRGNVVVTKGVFMVLLVLRSSEIH